MLAMIDMDMGNLQSVRQAFERVGALVDLVTQAFPNKPEGGDATAAPPPDPPPATAPPAGRAPGIRPTRILAFSRYRFLHSAAPSRRDAAAGGAPSRATGSSS